MNLRSCNHLTWGPWVLGASKNAEIECLECAKFETRPQTVEVE